MIKRRTRNSVIESLPPPGPLSQHSSKHLDLLFALAYPKRESNDAAFNQARNHSPQKLSGKLMDVQNKMKEDDDDDDEDDDISENEEIEEPLGSVTVSTQAEPTF
jgi:hypothetical protein